MMIYDNMPDYSECVIYTIKTPTGLYVGSTCNFVNRKYSHNFAIHNKNGRYERNLYKNIRENNNQWEMKPYKLFPCKNKMEMNIEEERIRRELNADLNMYSCYGLDKEKLTEKKKQYYQDNKDKFVERHKQYYQDNKEKYNELKRQWREKNREKENEYNKQYYQENKEKIVEKSRKYYKKKQEEKQENINMEFDN